MSRVLVNNNDKERAKTYIKNDIRCCQTELYDASNKLHEIVTLLNNAESGSLVGNDKKLIDQCKQTISEISNSLTFLNNSIHHVDQISTEEWVADNAVYR